MNYPYPLRRLKLIELHFDLQLKIFSNFFLFLQHDKSYQSSNINNNTLLSCIINVSKMKMNTHTFLEMVINFFLELFQ